MYITWVQSSQNQIGPYSGSFAHAIIWSWNERPGEMRIPRSRGRVVTFKITLSMHVWNRGLFRPICSTKLLSTEICNCQVWDQLWRASTAFCNRLQSEVNIFTSSAKSTHLALPKRYPPVEESTHTCFSLTNFTENPSQHVVPAYVHSSLPHAFVAVSSPLKKGHT